MNWATSRNYGGLRQLLRELIRKTIFVAPVRKEQWLSDLYAQYGQKEREGTVSVDLGCGLKPRNPFRCRQALGVDIRRADGVIRCNLASEPLPFESLTLQVITAYDVLEHIPREALGMHTEEGSEMRFPFIELMNEIHRCLRPDGLFFAAFPCYPWPMAFQDPTHVNIMAEDTIRLNFCGENPWARIYGFNGGFQLLDEGWIGSHFHVLLKRG